MLICNVLNGKQELVGKLFIGDVIRIDEKGNELVRIINKIKKQGVIRYIPGGVEEGIDGDDTETIHEFNENNFSLLEEALYSLGYIIEDIPVKEV